MKPKFSWEPLDGGSLRLTLVSGAKSTAWTIKPKHPTTDLGIIFSEIGGLLIDEPQIGPRVNTTEVNYWAERPMVEQVSTVEQEDLDRLREEASLKSLADKADSVKLDGRNFWASSDMDELDLYVLGDGDPE